MAEPTFRGRGGRDRARRRLYGDGKNSHGLACIWFKPKAIWADTAFDPVSTSGSSANNAPHGSGRDDVVRIKCPKLDCQRILAVPINARGKLVRCRNCGTNIKIPAAPRQAPAPPRADKNDRGDKKDNERSAA